MMIMWQSLHWYPSLYMSTNIQSEGNQKARETKKKVDGSDVSLLTSVIAISPLFFPRFPSEGSNHAS